MKIKKRKNKFLLPIVTLVGLFLLGMSSHIKIVTYDIESSKVDKAIKMILLTDLHSCSYGENQKDLLDAVNGEKPDIILFSGDIFDDKMDNTATLIALESLSELYPCYYVTGNHEIWSGQVNQMKEVLKTMNIHVLEGDSKVVNVRGQEINICGVDDPTIDGLIGEEKFRDQLLNLKHTKENGLYTILLSHRPEYIESYLEIGFDLILAGHAHGGQWRLPGIINGLYAPGQGLFPEFAGGQYKVLLSEMIVSRGLAKESTPVPRFFNRPEVVY